MSSKLPKIPKGAKQIDDKDLTIEQLLSVIHYLLEDESRKRKNFGNELNIEAEFITKDEKGFKLQAIATNQRFVCSSFRYFDKKLTDWHYHTWKTYDKSEFVDEEGHEDTAPGEEGKLEPEIMLVGDNDKGRESVIIDPKKKRLTPADRTLADKVDESESESESESG